MMLKGVHCEEFQDRLVPVNWEDCLNCARDWNYYCTFTLPLLKAIQADAAQGHYFPSVSGLVCCLRKTVLLQTEDYYEYPSRRVPLLVGTAIHSLVEVEDDDVISEIDLRYEVDGTLVGGRCDMYVKKKKELVDWKTAKDLYINRMPYGHHAEQINLYAFMLENNQVEPRLPVEALRIAYISKSGNKTGSHNGVMQVPIEKWPAKQAKAELIKRTRALMEGMNGKLPPRKAKDWECKICPVIAICEKKR